MPVFRRPVARWPHPECPEQARSYILSLPKDVSQDVSKGRASGQVKCIDIPVIQEDGG